MHTQLKFEKLKGKYHLGAPNLDGRIILKWRLENSI
jgi:hypothetical protein